MGPDDLVHPGPRGHPSGRGPGDDVRVRAGRPTTSPSLRGSRGRGSGGRHIRSGRCVHRGGRGSAARRHADAGFGERRCGRCRRRPVGAGGGSHRGRSGGSRSSGGSSLDCRSPGSGTSVGGDGAGRSSSRRSSSRRSSSRRSSSRRSSSRRSSSRRSSGRRSSGRRSSGRRSSGRRSSGRRSSGRRSSGRRSSGRRSSGRRSSSRRSSSRRSSSRRSSGRRSSSRRSSSRRERGRRGRRRLDVDRVGGARGASPDTASLLALRCPALVQTVAPRRCRRRADRHGGGCSGALVHARVQHVSEPNASSHEGRRAGGLHRDPVR